MHRAARWVCLLGGAFASVASIAVAADDGLRCTEDDALTRAAAELLAGGVPPAPDTLDRAVRDAGSDSVGVRALYMPTEDPTQARAWLARFGSQADAPTVCGRAVGTTGALFVVASRGGSLDALTKESTHVRGWIAQGFTHAELVVSDAYGSFQRLPVDSAALARGVAIAEDLARPARVQLLARGPSGPRPLAERVIPARAAAVDAPQDDSDGLPQGVPVGQLLGAFRRAHQISPLRGNTLLDKVAAEHAGRVCAEGRVVHALRDGDPEQRLRAAGIGARLVGETVARARDQDLAFAAMRRSPSHRMTLLDDRFTDVGVATVRDRGDHECVVVLLAAWPRYLGR